MVKLNTELILHGFTDQYHIGRVIHEYRWVLFLRVLRVIQIFLWTLIQFMRRIILIF